MSAKKIKLIKETVGYATYNMQKLDENMNRLYRVLDMFEVRQVDELENLVYIICAEIRTTVVALNLNVYNLGKMDGDLSFANDTISAYWCSYYGEFYDDRFRDEFKRLMHQMRMSINLLDCFRSSMMNFERVAKRQNEDSAVEEMIFLGKNLYHELYVAKRVIEGVKILMTTYVKHKKKR